MREINLTHQEIVAIECKRNQIKLLQRRRDDSGSLMGFFPILGAADSAPPIAAIVKSLMQKSRQMTSARRDRALLDEHLVAKGYVRKNGAIDYPRFYNLAQIPQPTWSRYFNATNKDAPVDAILKIVLALRLPTQEAMDFMSSAGAGFYSGNERDSLILAFIDSDYLGLTDIEEIQNKVFDILECFLRETKAGNIENLYDF